MEHGSGRAGDAVLKVFQGGSAKCCAKPEVLRPATRRRCAPHCATDLPAKCGDQFGSGPKGMPLAATPQHFFFLFNLEREKERKKREIYKRIGGGYITGGRTVAGPADGR